MDVLDFVFPAITDVLAVDLAVQPAGEQMIDRSALWKAFGPGVFLGVEFAPEGGRALAPVGRGEGEELTGHKIAGMRVHNVEKAGFRLGVAESLQSLEMDRVDFHGARIRAVISRSSRTRRERDASTAESSAAIEAVKNPARTPPRLQRGFEKKKSDNKVCPTGVAVTAEEAYPGDGGMSGQFDFKEKETAREACGSDYPKMNSRLPYLFRAHSFLPSRGVCYQSYPRVKRTGGSYSSA